MLEPSKGVYSSFPHTQIALISCLVRISYVVAPCSFPKKTPSPISSMGQKRESTRAE